MNGSTLVGLSLVLLSARPVLPVPVEAGSRPARQEKAPPTQVSPSGATRTIQPNAITSLPLSNPYCYQPDPAFDACYVNARYAAAFDDGTGNILAYIKILIDSRLVAKLEAFFESSIYFDHTMIHGPGFRVPCGLSGASGDPDPAIGKRYVFEVKAYDVTNNWVLDDQLTVGCPAYHP